MTSLLCFIFSKSLLTQLPHTVVANDLNKYNTKLKKALVLIHCFKQTVFQFIYFKIQVRGVWGYFEFPHLKWCSLPHSLSRFYFMLSIYLTYSEFLHLYELKLPLGLHKTGHTDSIGFYLCHPLKVGPKRDYIRTTYRWITESILSFYALPSYRPQSQQLMYEIIYCFYISRQTLLRPLH